MKPSWDDAPMWANYLAMNPDGSWKWWECEPEPSHGAWWATTLTGKTLAATPREEAWQDTLEPRP
jgi:hypothetical protein